MIWAAPADDNHLAEHEVHLWRIFLVQPGQVLQQCLEVLNEEEAARASRFYFERDRTRFTVARAALRSVLAQYLGIAPVDIHFRYGPQGKPDLSLEHSASPLKFNLSHSGDYALLGVTRRAELGVDIELIRPDFGTHEIAERFFSSSESRLLLDLPEEQRCESFFHCWTRKEAYIKALGGGLSIPLDSFDVAFVPGAEAALLRVAENPHEVARWRIYDLPAASGYCAAAMVEGQRHELRCWDWDAALLKSNNNR
jgi:4'-phosphopantetheinyl transferase